MRKRVNILFVALATTSVVYGMILRYSPQPTNILSEQGATMSAEEVVNYEDDIEGLDAISASNPD